MRTTISLHDRLAEAVRRKAAETGRSVSGLIAEILDDRLKRVEPRAEKPFRLITVRGEGASSGPRSGIDLDRPRDVEIADDEATWPSRD